MVAKRDCPQDFVDVFLDVGRKDCEEVFQASFITVSRWLRENGGQELIDARADVVRKRREAARNIEIAVCHLRAPQPMHDAETLAAAAHFMRNVRNGGWFVTVADNGWWWLGTRKVSWDELVERAARKGFEAPCLVEPERMAG